MKTWINDILNSSQRVAIPIMTHPGIEAIGRTVKDAVTDGRVHYEAIKYLSDTYPTGASTVIMDLTVEAEAFGATIQITEDEVPSVTGRLVHDADSVDALGIPDMNTGRIPQYLLANQLAAEHIQDKPVLAGCIGPFSLAGRLYDMSEIMVGMYIEPDVIMNLLAKCTRFLIDYCRALKATGVAGVILAEPAAGLLSNDDSLVFSTEYVRQIVEAVQDDDFALILHNCGNTGQSTPSMVASGARALHFGNKIDMLQALEDCPSDVLVMGNLDPVGIFKQAGPEGVRQATLKLLEQTRAYPNFVISTGCDVPPAVPQENIQAFFEAVDTFNKSL